VRSVYRLESDPFPIGGRPFWRVVDEFGTCPGNVLGFGAGLGFLASFKIGAWAQWRQAALFIALCVALGPGLRVNEVLKKTLLPAGADPVVRHRELARGRLLGTGAGHSSLRGAAPSEDRRSPMREGWMKSGPTHAPHPEARP
jgi:hypothetical protein